MSKVKISIITGFLGSGKTTFLSEILSDIDSSNLAIIVNEFGQNSLDDTILNASYAKEKTTVIGSGCMCCNKRDDLIIKLKDILNSYELNGKRLDRVIIETTGLANPAPILWTVLSDPFLSNHFEIAGLFTCVDAINGLNHLNHQEAINQISASDSVIITKSDLNSDYNELCKTLKSIYAGVKIYDKRYIKFSDLFNDVKKDYSNIEQNSHTQGLSSISLNFNKPVEWSAFTIWLSLLLHRYGAQILRTKGIISTKQNHLISINSVCHIVHPPRHIDNLNGENPGSCIVIIAQNLDLNLVKESLKSFLKVELE